MNRLNILFSLFSLTTCIIIIERLLPASYTFLQPYNFAQVHQIVQAVILIPLTVLLSFFILKEITNNFQKLQTKRNVFLTMLFVLGVYFYGAGEGWHEYAILLYNSYCQQDGATYPLCKGIFINAFYTGNIIFFTGGVLMNTALLALSAQFPVKQFSKAELVILFLNSVVYALTWFAYAAFDVVPVGLFFSGALMLISVGFLIKRKNSWKMYPYLVFSTFAYTLATVSSFIMRTGNA